MGVLKFMLVCGLITCSIHNAVAIIPWLSNLFFGTPMPTAQINNSRIIGQTIKFAGKKVHQYAGVPFAEPPIGPLRFQKPQPIKSYPPEYRAFTNPPACLQYTKSPFPWYASGIDKSEDCLYLNIWTPADASPSNKKAVMYWMYGGGHRYGSMQLQIYNGTRLAALGDIIVVTVNYRMGYFGFLTSNSFEAPGNAGVWDVLEGLRWVNKYIESFGGDVSRITISGESAGSINVGFLSISPLSKGLYARQIMESASPAYRRGDNNTQNLMFSQQLAVYVGCANDTYTIDAHPKEVVKCLQGIDADVLTKADYDFAPKSGAHLVPQFGDEILVENPRVSVINNNFRCTDLLIGNNKDEGSYSLTAFTYRDYFGFHGEKNAHVNRSFGESIIRTAVALFPDPDAIVNYYLPPNLTDDTDYRIRQQVYTVLGDTVLLCPTVYYAEKCTEQNKNVYFYFFRHRPSNSPWAPWMGTTHFDEVQFVFGQPVYNSTYEATESQLSKQIINIWSSFVRNGKPNIRWPLYNKKDRKFKYIGPNYVSGENGQQGPHTANCEFLKPHFGF